MVLHRIQLKWLLAALAVIATFTAAPFANSADTVEITFPGEGSTLDDTKQLFSWHQSDYDEFWVYLGSEIGSNDIYNSGSLGPANGITVYALPHDGRTIFFRLFFRQSNQTWSYTDHSFQAHTGSSAIGLISPKPGSTLDGTIQSFSWHGTGIDEWWVYIGTRTGENDLYNSGNLGSATVADVAALPHDGRTIYSRLFYRQAGAAWRYHDYSYVSTTGKQAINIFSPASGTAISREAQRFNWVGTGIDEWWLYLGTSVGANNIYNSGNLGAATSAAIPDLSDVPDLPDVKTALHARLFYRQSGASWRFVDLDYTLAAANNGTVDNTDNNQVTTVTDLVALHYDISPDLDDLQAIAAGANLSDKYGVSPAVVIGAYGLVGLGGPADSDLKHLYDTATNSLGQGPNIGETRQQKARQVTDAAYGAGNYLDTGDGWTEAVNAQAQKFWTVLKRGYTVSVADGGPMDFTADVLSRLQSFHGASNEQLKRVMVVQHSLGFNVTKTLPSNRSVVSNLATYVTIDNGNIGGNATANLEDSGTNTTSSAFAQWARSGNSKAAAWNSALDDFSAKIDFSDTVEYLYILDIPLSSVSDINSFSSFF
jgi:hypothetical protein